MNILLTDFSTKVGRDDDIKRTVRNESSHETSNDNGDGVVKLAISKESNFQEYRVHTSQRS
jgi:hypothetical protein